MRLLILFFLAFLLCENLNAQFLISKTENQEIRALTNYSNDNCALYAVKHTVYKIDSTLLPRLYINAPKEHLIRCLEIDTVNHILISAGKDKHIYLWDIKTKKQINQATQTGEIITDITLSPDNKQLIAVNTSGSIMMWSYPDMIEQINYKGHTVASTSILFSKDAKQLISSDMHGKIKIWENHTFKSLAEFNEHNGGIYKICYGLNKKELYSIDTKSRLLHWTLNNGLLTKINELPIHIGPISDIHIFDHKGSFCAISLTGKISISIQFGKYTAKIKDPLTCIIPFASSDSKLRFLVGTLNKGLFLLKAEDMKYHSL